MSADRFSGQARPCCAMHRAPAGQRRWRRQRATTLPTWPSILLPTFHASENWAVPLKGRWSSGRRSKCTRTGTDRPSPAATASPVRSEGRDQFCMSLMKEQNRQRFKSGQRAYLDEWRMTEEQKRAVLDRDYNQMITLGGNIYFLAKIFSCDGQSFEQAAASMTGMSREDYRSMMLSGGRSPHDDSHEVTQADG